MADYEIIEATVDDSKIDLSRWQKHGKDRLYINKLGSSWDNFFVDLDGDEGHSTPFVNSDIDVDGDVVTVSWTRTNESVRKVVVDLAPDRDDNPTSEVPPEVPLTNRNQGLAQQINAQNGSEGDR